MKVTRMTNNLEQDCSTMGGPIHTAGVPLLFFLFVPSLVYTSVRLESTATAAMLILLWLLLWPCSQCPAADVQVPSTKPLYYRPLIPIL